MVWPQIRHAENDELVLLLLNQVDLALSSNLESHANVVDDDNDISNINADVDNDDNDANDENLDSLLCPNPRLDPDWPSNF